VRRRERNIGSRSEMERGRDKDMYFSFFSKNVTSTTTLVNVVNIH